MMDQRLAELAVRRSTVQAAMYVAAACGDGQWARDKRPILDDLDRRITILVRVLPAKIVNSAREITNAPI